MPGKEATDNHLKMSDSDMNPVPLGSRLPLGPSLAAIPVVPKDRQTARTSRRRKQLATDQQQVRETYFLAFKAKHSQATHTHTHTGKESCGVGVGGAEEGNPGNPACPA